MLVEVPGVGARRVQKEAHGEGVGVALVGGHDVEDGAGVLEGVLVEVVVHARAEGNAEGDEAEDVGWHGRYEGGYLGAGMARGQGV